jgi:hypothetical protein
MIKIFIAVIVFLTSCFATAQQSSFKVLTLFGTVEYRAPMTQSWNKVQIGENIKNDGDLGLAKKSYVALMYNDGRTLEMMNEGIFNMKDVEQSFKNSKKSVAQKFVNFVAQELIVDKSKSKTMKEYAAVVRVKPNHIESAIPSFTAILDSTMDFVWYNNSISESYLLNILNNQNALVFMDLVKDTSYSASNSPISFNKQEVYKWYVSDANNPQIISDTNSFYVYSLENKNRILDTLNHLLEEIKTNESPLNFLTVAAFCESKELNIDAIPYYEKVILMAGGSEEYKKLYAKFLLKHRLYLKTAELLDNSLTEE